MVRTNTISILKDHIHGAEASNMVQQGVSILPKGFEKLTSLEGTYGEHGKDKR